MQAISLLFLIFHNTATLFLTSFLKGDSRECLVFGHSNSEALWRKYFHMPLIFSSILTDIPRDATSGRLHRSSFTCQLTIAVLGFQDNCFNVLIPCGVQSRWRSDLFLQDKCLMVYRYGTPLAIFVIVIYESMFVYIL